MTLPKGWADPKLLDVADFNPKHPESTDRNQLVSFVPMPAVDEFLGSITKPLQRPLKEIWTGYTHFADGDVIFAKITPCMENGKAAIVSGIYSGIACGSTEFFVLRPTGSAEASWIWRYIRQPSFRADAEQHMSGAVGQRRVPRPYLENKSIPLPPKAEQRRIVAKLDALTARLARARAELDRVPVLIKNIRKTAYSRLWETSKRQRLTGLLAEPIRNGLSVAGSEHPPGIPALRLSALRGPKVNLADARYLPIDEARAAPYRLRAGDLLISRGNGTLSLVGKASLVVAENGKLPIFPDTAFRIRADTQTVCVHWLLHVWNSPEMRTQIESMARTTAGIWKIAQRDLVAVELPLDQFAGQKVLADELNSAFARADRLEAEAGRARALLDRLEAAILAKAFRGELVPQDPNDEPASVLLDRIRAERAAAPAKRRGRAAKTAA